VISADAARAPDERRVVAPPAGRDATRPRSASPRVGAVRRPAGRFASLRALAVALAALLGCGGAPSPAAPAPPPSPPLHLAPVTDLAPAAGLAWLVDARPRELFAHPELVVAMRALFPDARFDAFAERHGGVDLRQLDELAVFAYPEATLFLAGGVVDPVKVEAAFARRARIDGRAVDRKADPLGVIVRSWGSVSDQREQVAVLGRRVAALEIGHFGPLRAAELFAQGRLKRASPALRAAPFADLASALGDAPVRAFAPGPFQAEWGRALGGLLAASTGIAAALRLEPGGDERAEGGRARLTIALLGTWSRDPAAAGERLAAALHIIAESSLGKLCGLDHPATEPSVRTTQNTLVADVTVALLPLFRGLNAATAASADDILRY